MTVSCAWGFGAPVLRLGLAAQLSPTSPYLRVERRLVHELARVHLRPARDQLDTAVVGRRLAHGVEPRLHRLH